MYKRSDKHCWGFRGENGFRTPVRKTGPGRREAARREHTTACPARRVEVTDVKVEVAARGGGCAPEFRIRAKARGGDFYITGVRQNPTRVRRGW